MTIQAPQPDIWIYEALVETLTHLFDVSMSRSSPAYWSRWKSCSLVTSICTGGYGLYPPVARIKF